MWNPPPDSAPLPGTVMAYIRLVIGARQQGLLKDYGKQRKRDISKGKKGGGERDDTALCPDAETIRSVGEWGGFHCSKLDIR